METLLDLSSVYIMEALLDFGSVHNGNGKDLVSLEKRGHNDLGTGISPSPGSNQRTRHRSSAPARNSNSEASYATLLSRLAGIPGVEVLSDSEMAKRYQLHLVQRDTDACAVITAWWKMLRRPSGVLKALDKLGINLTTSSAVINLAPPPVDSVTPEDFKDLDKMSSPTIHLSPSILLTRLSGSP